MWLMPKTTTRRASRAPGPSPPPPSSFRRSSAIRCSRGRIVARWDSLSVPSTARQSSGCQAWSAGTATRLPCACCSRSRPAAQSSSQSER